MAVAADTLDPEGPEQWHDVTLPHGSEATRATCDLLRTDLTLLAVAPRVLDDAVIVAGELVLNALEHGRALDDGTIRFGWALAHRHLVLRVADAGEEGEVAPSAVGPESLRGRGLAMVAAICDSWSVQRGGGTTVTARIPL